MKFYILLFLLVASTMFAQKTKVLSSKSYLFQDLASKEVIQQKEVNSILPIASITKLVTALISVSEKQLDSNIKINQNSVRRNEGDKSAVLKESEVYSLKDLLLTMLVSSTNVSALSISTEISGSPENFVIKMNDWVKQNKLKDTSFGDTFGLSKDSKSSVEDISKILDLVEKNPALYEILTTTQYTIKEKKGRLQNLNTTNEMPYYKDFKIFGKTGTTKLAGKCFAGFVVKGNQRWKIILLGSENVFGDIKILLDEIK